MDQPPFSEVQFQVYKIVVQIFYRLYSIYVLCCAVLSQTLCDPMDCSLPDSFVHGSLQARILEWVAMPSSTGSSQPREQTRVSCMVGGFFTL